MLSKLLQRPLSNIQSSTSTFSCTTPFFIQKTYMSAKKKRPASKDFLTEFEKAFPNLEEEFIDTHCHIDSIINRLNQQEKNTDKVKPSTTTDECCGGNENEVVPATGSWNWEKLYKTYYVGKQPHSLTVACETTTFDSVLSLLDNDTTDTLRGAFGIHPHEAKHWSTEVEQKLVQIMSHPKVIAWGECGLDFYYNNSARDEQIACFIRQIELAVEHKKPLVVHTRDAEEDTLDILRKHLPKDHFVHIHCCTSSLNMVTPLLAEFPNLYIGFTGCITFPSATENRETVKNVPLNRLLLETDGPYMAPVPLRGQIAHPGMIPFIAKVMAEVHQVDLTTVLRQIRENTRTLYKM